MNEPLEPLESMEPLESSMEPLEPMEPTVKREGIHPGIIFAVLLVVLAVSGYVYWAFFRGGEPEAPAALVTPPPAVAPPAIDEPAPPPLPPLPPLDDSDPLVRELVSALSARPQLVTWLANEELVRTFVAAVDDVARGESPRPVVPFLAPEGRFRARDESGALRVDPRSHARYDLLTDVVGSLDTDGMAELYRRLEPLFDQAYLDLGYPEGDFRTTLARAIAELRATPVATAAELERVGDLYRYADPELEELSPAQKNLLRMGPENALKIQEKLRLIGRALGVVPAE